MKIQGMIEKMVLLESQIDLAPFGSTEKSVEEESSPIHGRKRFSMPFSPQSYAVSSPNESEAIPYTASYLKTSFSKAKRSPQPINLNETLTNEISNMRKIGTKRFSNLLTETKVQADTHNYLLNKEGLSKGKVNLAATLYQGHFAENFGIGLPQILHSGISKIQ